MCNYKEGGRYVWKEPTLLLIWMYYIMHRYNGNIGRIISALITPPYYVLSIVLGVNIPRSTSVKGGLRVHHYGCIVVNSYTKIGRNCTLRQGVTIGNKNREDDCPVIGDNCDIGAGAKILGAIHIGNNVTIGANAVVVKDVPDNCIVGGIPAKIIKMRT